MNQLSSQLINEKLVFFAHKKLTLEYVTRKLSLNTLTFTDSLLSPTKKYFKPFKYALLRVKILTLFITCLSRYAPYFLTFVHYMKDACFLSIELIK